MKHSLSPFFILKTKENKIATEPREFVNQVLSNPLYASELFRYNLFKNMQKDWDILNLCIFLLSI